MQNLNLEKMKGNGREFTSSTSSTPSPLSETLEKFFSLIGNYLGENDHAEVPVVEYKKAGDLKAVLNLTISPLGCSEEELFAEMETFLKYSVRTGHKNFLNQLFSRTTWPGMVGDFLATATNTTMATYEVSPVGTLVEQALLEKLKDLVGYRDGEGLFVTGGSNANLVAMLCARNNLFPEGKEKGLGGLGKLLVFISEEAHYSYQKAANCIGIGTDQVIPVPTDPQGRMVIPLLEKRILEEREKGGIPFFIGATAGTTVIGAFDPFPELRRVADQFGLWFHVDGAYGGSLLLSHSHKSLLEGCDLSDSFGLDAHKVMGIPLICSAILFRRKGDLFRGQGGGGKEYLFHDYENEAFDLGKLSLQCGRRMDALKLWLSWKFLGDAGYEKRINKLMELSAFAGELVENHPQLRLVAPRESLNVCFQYHPHDYPPGSEELEKKEKDHLNLNIRERLVQEGRFMINYAHWKGKVILRAVFLNPDLDFGDVTAIFNAVVEIGNDLSQPLPSQ